MTSAGSLNLTVMLRMGVTNQSSLCLTQLANSSLNSMRKSGDWQSNSVNFLTDLPVKRQTDLGHVIPVADEE